MAQWKLEEVKELLHTKIKDELIRMKRKHLKMTPYSVAHVTADFVLALMSDARRREVRRAQQWMEQNPEGKISHYLKEREREMTNQAKAVWNLAEGREQERTGHVR